MSDRKQDSTTTIVALAGRRIDSPGVEEPRFPLKNVDEVRRRIADALVNLPAVRLVCSGACGADLVALEAAAQLGLHRRIVLPFAPARFRETSVVDRPGEWGPVFDRQIAAAAATGDLVVLGLEGDDDQAYAATNEAIIREAKALAGTPGRAGAHRLIAMLVWEGTKRQGSDATAGFGDLAKKSGFEERSIPTL
jgi:hypothetical protein